MSVQVLALMHDPHSHIAGAAFELVQVPSLHLD